VYICARNFGTQGSYTVMCMRNNFNLIRLLAAMQVMACHCNSHLHLGGTNLIWTIINCFPGVPIFFFVSGFLISKSYEHHNNLRIFYTNRCYRIYPELWVCFIISMLTVIFSGYEIPINSRNLFGVISQLSCFQWYGISGISDYGVGVLNGSLWTISIEIQFYILLPLLYQFRLFSNKFAFLLFICFSSTLPHICQKVTQFYPATIGINYFVNLTLLPYLWMFLIGVWMQKNFSLIQKYLTDKLLFWLTLYLVLLLIFNVCKIEAQSGILPNVIFIILSCTVLSFAFSYRTLSNFLLKGNDISYGIYIYHMIIVNLIVEHILFVNPMFNFITAIILTTIISTISWQLVGEKYLQLKKKSLMFVVSPIPLA
jgi:peptidoglycan/LPS O-acetylase OafA/YrhL